MEKGYDGSHIQTYSPLEGMRLKLGMYVGSNSNNAIHHIIKEMISNSIDEYLAGYGNKIIIKIDKINNSIIVQDEGRGIPLDKIEDVCTKPHTSGKFSKDGDAPYGASGGLNGIGLKVAVATGRLEVTVGRDNKEYFNYFHYQEKGIANIQNKKIKQTYSILKWTPDKEVFTDATIKEEEIVELCQDLSYITPNLIFIIHGKIQHTIKSKGIADFLTDYITESNMSSPIMSFKKGDNYLMVEGAMVWTKNTNLEQSYVNLIPTCDGGTHVTVLKTVLTREINKFLKSDLKGEEIRRGLTFILSVKTLEEAVFKGQNKDSLNMPTINAPLSGLLKQEIELLLSKYKDFFENLKKSIETSRKKEVAMDKVREVLLKAKSKANSIPNKLKPALNKQGAELFITEGDSASGSLITHRDKYKHAIMSLRGKPINVKKHELEKVLDNQEIKDLIIAMGGFGEDYNHTKCPYDKIIFLADSDVDGSHIQLLLITFFFQFYPQLIREGKIYTVKTPLYIIKTKKELKYVFSEIEMTQLKKSLSKDCIISRAKGLGELNPTVLSNFVFSDKRILIQYKMEDEQQVEELLENFMGVDGTERREFVN